MLVNPLFVRMAAVFVLTATAFVMGLVVVRVLRRRLVEGSEIGEDLGPENSDATYPYTAVIQELKQQKFALENEQQAQRRRAKTSEQISAALIANLPCGVLFVGTNGLVKQANSAAKRILGFASPLGMSVAEVFRGRRPIQKRRLPAAAWRNSSRARCRVRVRQRSLRLRMRRRMETSGRWT